MKSNEIDSWVKEEPLAVRHAGSLYAGALAVIALLHKDSASTPDLAFLKLKMGVALLLIGIVGSIFYQLFTIQLGSKGSDNLIIRRSAAALVVLGAFGFGFLASYVSTI